jgi:hypothetical protein
MDNNCCEKSAEVIVNTDKTPGKWGATRVSESVEGLNLIEMN